MKIKSNDKVLVRFVVGLGSIPGVEPIRDISRHTTIYISRSSQCPTTGVTKAVVCAILSVGWCI